MQSLETKPLLLDVHRITLRVTHEEFEKLCQDNLDRSFELTATGELIVMAPVGGESGNSESEDRKSTRLNSSHPSISRMPSSA